MSNFNTSFDEFLGDDFEDFDHKKIEPRFIVCCDKGYLNSNKGVTKDFYKAKMYKTKRYAEKACIESTCKNPVVMKFKIGLFDA